MTTFRCYFMVMSCSPTRGWSLTLAGKQSGETCSVKLWPQFACSVTATITVSHPCAGGMRLLVQTVLKPPTHQPALSVYLCAFPRSCSTAFLCNHVAPCNCIWTYSSTSGMLPHQAAASRACSRRWGTARSPSRSTSTPTSWTARRPPATRPRLRSILTIHCNSFPQHTLIQVLCLCHSQCVHVSPVESFHRMADFAHLCLEGAPSSRLSGAGTF